MQIRRKHSILSLVGIASLAYAMTACSPGGNLQGTTTQKTPKTENATPETPPVPYTQNPNTTVPSSPSSLPAVPTTTPVTPTTTTIEEGPDVPSPITGALLFCFKDKSEGAKATVLCAVEDKVTKKPISLAGKYVSHTFDAAAPAALKVVAKELPISGLWHVEYTVTGASAEIVTAGLSSVNFAFVGVDINNLTESYSMKITNEKRPNLTIQSMKPQTAAEFRCMDYFVLKGDKVLTSPCGAQTSAQDWFITAENKIAHTSGVCIKFNPVSKLMIEGDCSNNDTPRFEFSGEQIKILNTNTCIGLIIPDNSGYDYPGSVTCNTGDITQHWKVSPTILP